MVVKKMVEDWELSNDDKKVIKENAQKLKTFFVLRNCDDCQEFYGWCNSDDVFLDYIGRILPFIKEEKRYILVDDIQNLIYEIDSAIENVKTCIAIDDFCDEDDLIDFIIDRYNNNIKLARKIVEVCDEESISKLLND